MARSLKKYREMRHFDRTPEPSGKKMRGGGDSFVVQKHDASHLHYDFRLEIDGVLVSWAVPKGPSLQVGERRLAMRTEDHPLAYGSFEGTIPEGNYGAGEVEIWDRGTWQCEGDPSAALKKGRITFAMKGKKLAGRWHLVRTDEKKWLLFKGTDAANEDVHTSVKLTNLDKVLYPEDKLTKAALVAYYVKVAEHMLPHVLRRPLSLFRCPDGRHKFCFFQKHLKSMPQEIFGEDDYMYIKDRDGLLALAQMGVLETHIWGCHLDAIEKPDRLVFDLDPDPSLAFTEVVDAAFELRELLNLLGLESFAMTTGGKGLHLVAPVQRRLDWDTFKAFSKDVALTLERSNPEMYVTNPLKKLRKGKIFVDYLRNGRGATAICPYSTRAREGATVAMPVDWDELESLDPGEFTLTTAPKRAGHAWRDYFDVKQSITAAMRKKVKP